MTNEQLKIIQSQGWTVECESPLEISHSDGSFATMNAAIRVIADVVNEYKQEQPVLEVLETVVQLSAINDFVQNIVASTLVIELDAKRAKELNSYAKEADWKSAYGLVFNPKISIAAFNLLIKINSELNYYDPDSSYKDDVMAFAIALDEKVTYLEHITTTKAVKKFKH